MERGKKQIEFVKYLKAKAESDALMNSVAKFCPLCGSAIEEVPKVSKELVEGRWYKCPKHGNFGLLLFGGSLDG